MSTKWLKRLKGTEKNGKEQERIVGERWTTNICNSGQRKKLGWYISSKITNYKIEKTKSSRAKKLVR